METKIITIKTGEDVLKARGTGRNMVHDMGFGSADQTRLATAVSELTRNVVQYAGEGTCEISPVLNSDKTGVRVVVEDSGPGIADIDEAMKEGFSSGIGLGAGLPGTKRLVTFFELESEPGHTKVTIELTGRKI